MAMRTDLACEACELHKVDLPDGIFQETRQFGSVRVVTVTVETADAGAIIGKPEGKYITVEVPSFSGGDYADFGAAEVIARQLSELLPQLDREGTVLVAGIGNRNITPDALGPLAAERIVATRHIGYESKKQLGLEKFSSVAVISPGVLAQTGIETGELISSVADKIEPTAVIIIDALAAMDISRLGCTVQLSDSGISPGSGVCNSRKRIDEALLGTKVISIGVPTVVDAATLAEELSGVDCRRGNAAQNMMITPREIDVIIERAAMTVAMGINYALHPEVPDDILKSIVC